MSERKDLEHIFDALGRVLESALRHQETAERQQAVADASLGRIEVAAEKLDGMARELKGQVSREISAAIPQAAERAAELLTEKFKEANRLAEAAAERYRSSVRWAVWKVAIGAAVAGAAAMGAGAYVVLHSVPSYSEMQARRADYAALEQNIAKLEQRGGRAQFSYCEDGSKKGRLCIKIDEAAPPYQQGFRVIAGY